MNRPLIPVSFDHHHDAIEGVRPGPWDGWSRLDRLDGLDTRGPAPTYQPAIAIRPVVRHRATRRRSIKWGSVVSNAALVAAITFMTAIVAAVFLNLGGVL